MTFEEYLTGKNIDSAAFKAQQAQQWQEWQNLFDQMHPNSFNEQKKFLINEVRRKYLLKTPVSTSSEPKPSEEPAAPPAVAPSRKGPIIRKKPAQ